MSHFKLVVEKGVCSGQTFEIKPEGISLGRASTNDVHIPDSELSRRHCQIYFVGQDPWLTDLATLNGTSVNGVPITNAINLKINDLITMGETVIRVAGEQPVADTLTPPLAPPEAPASAPAISITPITCPEVPPKAETPKAETPHQIDLGFSDSDEDTVTKVNTRNIKRTLILAGAIFVTFCLAAIALKMFTQSSDESNEPIPIRAPAEQTLEIYYTKLEGTAENIFRYELELDSERMLTVSIDDLTQGRHVRKTSEKPIPKDVIKEIVRKFEYASFASMDDVFEGIPRENTWNTYTLTAIINKDAKTVSVRNRIEPDAFKVLRAEIETFSRNELGLWAIEFSHERLLELARESQLVGQKRFDEREIRDDNLFNAVQSFKACLSYLETIEPKPEFYDDAVNALQDAELSLEEIYKEKNWQADHAINTKQWHSAATILRELMGYIPDRTDPRNRDAERRLLDVESRIKKQRN